MAYAGQEDEVHGECVGDSSTGLAFTLYLAGTTTQATIGSTDQLFITEITGSADEGTEVVLFSGANLTAANGERILSLRWQTDGEPVCFKFPTPHRCIVGTYPAASNNGNSYFTLRGYIRRG